MSRLSRAQTQERNRATVLAAARDEFVQRGFRDAKIDVIAERAELTRGAVYSNFPSKRALYLAVLAEDAEHTLGAPHARPGHTVAEALGALAGAWVSRPALAIADRTPGLASDLLPEILADEAMRRPFTQLMRLDALLLGLALERLRPPSTEPGAPPARLVRMADIVLTTLHGASQLAAAAPGFVEPFDVVSACEQLAGLALNDWWSPPPDCPPARQVHEPWSPAGATDLVSGEPARLTDDAVVVVLGLNRTAAIEEAVRAASTEVVAVLVTSDPAEFAALARLTVAELCGCLRVAFPRSAWPRLQVVCDEGGALAAAAGVAAVSDETETAVRVEGGRVVARAEGRGAGHAVAARVPVRRN